MNNNKTQSSKFKVQSLKGKRVLITAGPTWAPIDDVRIISNTATGETGRLIAEKLVDTGAKITLLINSENSRCLNKKIKILKFRFFDQLKKNIINELSSGRYDIFIHSAAVSDYLPAKPVNGKISSDKNSLRLDLIPAPKIINRIKRADSGIFLVGFKYIPDAKKSALLSAAKKLMNISHCDIVVANTMGKNGYQAYILNRNNITPDYNKSGMVINLIKEISKYFGLKKPLQKSN